MDYQRQGNGNKDRAEQLLAVRITDRLTRCMSVATRRAGFEPTADDNTALLVVRLQEAARQAACEASVGTKRQVGYRVAEPPEDSCEGRTTQAYMLLRELQHVLDDETVPHYGPTLLLELVGVVATAYGESPLRAETARANGLPVDELLALAQEADRFLVRRGLINGFRQLRDALEAAVMADRCLAACSVLYTEMVVVDPERSRELPAQLMRMLHRIFDEPLVLQGAGAAFVEAGLRWISYATQGRDEGVDADPEARALSEAAKAVDASYRRHLAAR